MFETPDDDVLFNIFVEQNGEYIQLFYNTRRFVIVDGYLEVHVVEYVEEESGGFGVISVKIDFGYANYSLNEGAIPELTEEIVFASAIIDGKLIILKDEVNFCSEFSEEADENSLSDFTDGNDSGYEFF